MVENIYNRMRENFSITLKNASKDKENAEFMTLCKQEVVSVDKLKNRLTRDLSLEIAPMSCDALCMVSQNEFFMIEFKNGRIYAQQNYEIMAKIFESLLMLSEKFTKTIEFMRNNMNFILVYNENKQHGDAQLNDTGIGSNEQRHHHSLNMIQDKTHRLANKRMIRFGLHRFKKLYFKDVFTYSVEQFEEEFVRKYYDENDEN